MSYFQYRTVDMSAGENWRDLRKGDRFQHAFEIFLLNNTSLASKMNHKRVLKKIHAYHPNVKTGSLFPTTTVN
jgi:hypothetical protein